jgi:hypothetical protein
LLVGEDLAVGETAVVVDGGVDVRVADSARPVLAPAGGGPSVGLVAPADGDTAQLLHIDVHQLARAAALVAADDPPGGAVEVVQAVEVVAGQDPVDGRGRQAEAPGNAIGAGLVGPADAAHLRLGALGRALRGAQRPAGPIVGAVGAELQVAVPPLRRALAGDAHRVGDMGNRDARGDALAQQQSARRGQWGVTVAQGDLREGGLASTPAHLLPEVFSRVDPAYRVNNVRERNV